MEQVLCYWPDPDSPCAAAARRVILPMKIRMKTAGPEQTGESIGALMGRKGFELTAAAPGTAEDPILVLDGFSGARLNQLLTGLRKAGVPRTVFKAVVTADNIGWSLAELWQELCRERDAMDSETKP